MFHGANTNTDRRRRDRLESRFDTFMSQEPARNEPTSRDRGSTRKTSRWDVRRSEPVLVAFAFVLVYAWLATLFFRHAPRLFADLDQAFDSDLGSWTIDLARPQGPHLRTRIHPLSVLLLNPLGYALRMPLQHAGIALAARLAAQLLCALAGGTAVGLFRVLLRRLDVSDTRARLWTLLFATTATQIVFSSLPESFAFSALSLLLVFVVAAGQRPTSGVGVATGVLSFGIVVTNLVAVALARCCTADRRRVWPWLRSCAGHITTVVLVAAALSLAQRVVYPTSEPFFVPKRLPLAYDRSFFLPDTASEGLERVASVLSYVGFAGLAAPRLQVDHPDARWAVVNFADIPILTPTPLSAIHWLLWAVLLVQAGRGVLVSLRARPPTDAEPLAARARLPPVVAALLLWLLFVVTLHTFFGTSLFLYSGHWVFALLVLTAWGLEQRPFVRPGVAAALLASLLVLQLMANGALVHQMLQIFWSA